MRLDSVAFSPLMVLLWQVAVAGRIEHGASYGTSQLSATTPAVLSISPDFNKITLTIGEQLTVSLNIVGGENVMGYQATVVFRSYCSHLFFKCQWRLSI